MRKLLLSLLLLAIVATACSGDDDGPGASDGAGQDGSVSLDGDDIQLLSRLVPFDGCGELLDHLQSEARDRVGPYGLDWSGSPWRFFEDDVAMLEEGDFGGDDAMAEGDGSAGVAVEAAETSGDGGESLAQSDSNFQQVSDDASESGSGGGDVVGTNVQELGVDEPDIVKTDGERIIAISNGLLTYVDLGNGDPTVTDQLQLPEGYGHELFFQGDRALVFTNGGNWGYPQPIPLTGTVDAEEEFADDIDIIEPEWYGPAAMIMELDLSNPDDIEVAGTLRIQGQYLSARSVGPTVRLALSSPPSQLPWVFPSSPAGEDRAERFNQELIDETTVEDWIPSYELNVGGESSTGPLLDCNRLHRPSEFAGFDVVSVLSFDLDDGLNPGDGTGVLAAGQTVYASTDRFYVATSKWAGEETVNGDFVEWNENYSTDIHAFSISNDGPAEYVASGNVEGSLLNQFSMDEHDGHLRIVTTEGSPWNEGNQSETVLSVFREDGDTLNRVGQVGGLGKGETLYSARLLDDIGFAVTFRQIDPFYVLDLSDPTDPKVTGELKIPGFSTYLHPMSDTLVLGIGQDATEQGRTTGLKVSLFDVSDVTDPREVAVWTLPDASSQAEYDHRAFQVIGDTVVLPVQDWRQGFNGAVLLEIGGETITEIGRIDHADDDAEPSSDCQVIESEQFSEENELFWIAQEGGRVQLCGPDDLGGYGPQFCEQIPVEEVVFWGDEESMQALLNELGAGPDDRIELCWPDGGEWQLQIQRTLAVDGTLWTMSPTRLQANDLDSLAVEASLGLGLT